MVKKDSLIKGTIILAAAALVARFLGIFQRIPLDNLMSTQSGVYFNDANNIYLMLLIIATGGIPSAISKMISQRYALGRPEEAQRIYRAALWFGSVTGVIVSVLLFVFAPFIATNISIEPGLDASIRAIAPALLLFPIIAMMRGYFQGRQMMMAGGLSQIVEQILRVITAVGLVMLVVSWDMGDRKVAAVATFGSVLGSIGAFGVMLYYARKLKRQDRQEQAALSGQVSSMQTGESELVVEASSQVKSSYRSIYKELFAISIPIVIAAMTVQFVYNFDTMLFNRLTGSFYETKEAAKQFHNWLAFRAQGIAGIPPILAIALSTSIIPVLSSAFSVRNMKEVERQTSLVMRIVVFTGVPAALTLTVAAVSVTGFLFGDANAGGSGIVAALTAGTIFQITMMTSNSILFGLGQTNVPMRHTLIGLVVKVIASLALAPLLGVYGLIIASTLCFVTIASLNLRVIKKEVNLSVLGARWLGYGVTIVISAGAGWMTDILVRGWLEGLTPRVGFLISALAAGMVSFGLYLALLILLKVVTAEDVRQFPGPLRKLLSPLIRLTMRSKSDSR
ncbi:stage V sporulation protein B [Paenibacillus baekrokdamisoli]|uniref:Stage V sporulation protein B n=1 Tax=Paenibacillus baekrokdamisoli TaxID=1712516 RepID=A0A3G9IS36_9BACL|nr:polysaccharide biosynthesis protein [Paenibacillus baekrokdamisoli]MBB3071261.1 stage V sporulation protein B [Paenibacillus baekrokdamisoli]BBH21677.1 stage V sporulation protein B [Paenibacillus baekrokdamisoli]